MKIRPLQDRIIVKRIEEEEKTKGGIIIPDSAKEKPMEGKVIAVGTGKILENGTKQPLEVKAGDRILFGKRIVPIHSSRICWIDHRSNCRPYDIHNI